MTLNGESAVQNTASFACFSKRFCAPFRGSALLILSLCLYVYVCIRELEGLIFQCGLRMDELKEQVEQMQQEQSTCKTPSPSSPLPISSSVPSEGGDMLTQPQVPSTALSFNALCSLTVYRIYLTFVPVNLV